MYKLRFHLGQGPNFMKWQLKNRNEISYFDPYEVTIRAYSVTLRNAPKVAAKIHAGAHKTVCAWLDCEFIDISPVEIHADFCGFTHLSFNPKKFPHWTVGESGWNFDGKFVGDIATIGAKVLTSQSPYVIIGSSVGANPTILNSF
jgi:hypothetical protein